MALVKMQNLVAHLDPPNLLEGLSNTKVIYISLRGALTGEKPGLYLDQIDGLRF